MQYGSDDGIASVVWLLVVVFNDDFQMMHTCSVVDHHETILDILRFDVVERKAFEEYLVARMDALFVFVKCSASGGGGEIREGDLHRNGKAREIAFRKLKSGSANSGGIVRRDDGQARALHRHDGAATALGTTAQRLVGMACRFVGSRHDIMMLVAAVMMTAMMGLVVVGVRLGTGSGCIAVAVDAGHGNVGEGTRHHDRWLFHGGHRRRVRLWRLI
mmetsp:Transcript_28537/g.80397  ORF Transcript_28537/g.80397 Transcript_28537/m.80397 type:complete len:217 (-) Transcript_28537:823-1473(-)